LLQDYFPQIVPTPQILIQFIFKTREICGKFLHASFPYFLISGQIHATLAEIGPVVLPCKL
jgi:hypothetical protein